MWQQSKEFRTPPSELLGIEDQPLAYYFNRAVFTFGRALEAELDRVSQQTGKGKQRKSQSQINLARSRVLRQWLGEETKFRDPFAEMKESSRMS